MYRYESLYYTGRGPEEAARRLPGPGPDAETLFLPLPDSFKLPSPRHSPSMSFRLGNA